MDYLGHRFEILEKHGLINHIEYHCKICKVRIWQRIYDSVIIFVDFNEDISCEEVQIKKLLE